MAKSNLPGIVNSDNFIDRMLAKQTAAAGDLAMRGAQAGAGTASGAELEAAVRRVLGNRPGQELQLGLLELANARALAAATWAAVKASRDHTGEPMGAAEKWARAGGAAAAKPMDLTGAGGLQPLLDWNRRLPHTYTTVQGKPCNTDTWISDGFMIYDPAIEPPVRGSVDNPWFGIKGPGFRCFYPGSSFADWESCMTSGSSGRWLARWPQRKSYTVF